VDFMGFLPCTIAFVSLFYCKTTGSEIRAGYHTSGSPGSAIAETFDHDRRAAKKTGRSYTHAQSVRGCYEKGLREGNDI